MIGPEACLTPYPNKVGGWRFMVMIESFPVASVYTAAPTWIRSISTGCLDNFRRGRRRNARLLLVVRGSAAVP